MRFLSFPNKKTLLIVLCAYVVLFFIPCLVYIYLFRSTPSSTNVVSSPVKIPESSESSSSVSLFGGLLGTSPVEESTNINTSKNTNMAKSFFAQVQHGKLKSFDGNILLVDVKDSTGKDIVKSLSLDSDSLLICSKDMLTDADGNKIDASTVYIDYSSMSDVDFKRLLYQLQKMNYDSRVEDLKAYSIDLPLQFSIAKTENGKNILRWVRIFDKDCSDL